MATADLSRLSYSSLLEALSERFHASPSLLKRLNPSARFVAGETLDEKGRATREAMFARIPLKRFAEPEDFVGALQYLLSDASTFMTGQVLYLDGGYTAF